YLVILNAMPKVALGPILIVALGPGYLSIIMMGALISVIITARVVYDGYNDVDNYYQKVLKGFAASKRQCVKEAILPATLATVIFVLDVYVGLSGHASFALELLIYHNGLGYLLFYFLRLFDFTLVMHSLVIIAILVALMYTVVEYIEMSLMIQTP